MTSIGPGRGALRAREIAAAAMLAAASVTVVTIGALLPRTGALELLAMIPLAVIADRFRIRALIAAIAAAAVTCFLIGGVTAGLVVIASGMVGGVVGAARRRGRGAWTMAAISAVLAPIAALAANALLLLLPVTRTLAIDAVGGTVSGFARFLGLFPGLGPVAQGFTDLAATVGTSWWLWVAVGMLAAVPCAVFITWRLLTAILARLDWVSVDDPLESAHLADSENPVGPLPVALHGVRVQYHGQALPALDGVDLRVEAGEFVVIEGPNGSGKSTLALVLAGLAINGGRVERPGGVGLGAVGGTALLTQRAEVGALGARLVDDILWGVDDPTSVDVDELLDVVGLPNMRDRATASLSGGQLQRLALAAALARRPSLLIADEATAMVDAAGRAELTDLLATLPQRLGMAVVHISHNAADGRRADRVVRMRDGRVEFDRAGPARARRASVAELAARALNTAGSVDPPLVRRMPQEMRDRRPATVAPLLRVRGAAYVHALGTPWEHRALTGVELDLGPGDGLLITGENGSGKTTLAWMLAGLLRPTDGSCELDGRPIADRIGSVALAFQHARLQLQKRTVREDILSAAGRAARSKHRDDNAFAEHWLETVGLPGGLADRGIDALSGGQQRRVAIAGILASRPRVLVLDEPFAGLDPAARSDLVATLLAVRDETNLAIAVVSHDLAGLEELCPRVLQLENGSPA
jgi:energy-coupling factor transport system ATP-binding protein